MCSPVHIAGGHPLPRQVLFVLGEQASIGVDDPLSLLVGRVLGHEGPEVEGGWRLLYLLLQDRVRLSDACPSLALRQVVVEVVVVEFLAIGRGKRLSASLGVQGVQVGLGSWSRPVQGAAHIQQQILGATAHETQRKLADRSDREPGLAVETAPVEALPRHDQGPVPWVVNTLA